MSAEVLAEVRRILAEEVGRREAVLPSHRLDADLQLDSVQLLTLVVGLENRFRIALAEEDAAQVRTVADLVALVERRRREAGR